VARGKCWKNPCKNCPNGMTEEEEIEITVDIQAGMMDGEKIKFDQVADEAVGHIAGDLIFTINQIPDAHFTRNGDDLSVSISISLLESLVGFSRTMKHLDGHDVEIKKSDVSFCSQIIKIAGEGMPRRSPNSNRQSAKQYGDLYVTLLIEFPKEFTAAQKNTLRQVLG
jgi:DnaJ family protein B protein 11